MRDFTAFLASGITFIVMMLIALAFDLDLLSILFGIVIPPSILFIHFITSLSLIDN